jgi:hypothetical protein
MPDITMKCEHTERWTKMRPSRARSSGPAASCHVRSSVDFITTTFESEFLVHTGFPCSQSDEIAQIRIDFRPPWPTVGFPAPVGPESSPMPAQNGGRLRLRRNVRHVCDGGPRRRIMDSETVDSATLNQASAVRHEFAERPTMGSPRSSAR